MAKRRVVTQGQDPAPGNGSGVLVLAFFGAIWLMLGCYRACRPVALPFACLAIAVAAGLIVHAAWRGMHSSRPDFEAWTKRPAGLRFARVFWITNVVEGLSIFAAVNVLAWLGLERWTLVAIMIAVGLHFLPLAWALQRRAHYVTGAALVGLALCYPLLTAAGPESPIGGLGAGLILWSAALSQLVSAARSQVPQAA